MITLSDGTVELELHRDLFWSDEGNWQPVVQAVARTLTGALDIQAASLTAGRPITLEPEDDSTAWMPFSTVAQLRNWAAVPGQVMELTLRGVSRSVIFRHHDGAAVEARPWVHYSDVQSGDWYFATIRFMEI